MSTTLAAEQIALNMRKGRAELHDLIKDAQTTKDCRVIEATCQALMDELAAIKALAGDRYEQLDDQEYQRILAAWNGPAGSV